MKYFMLFALTVVLAACSTPKVMMKNEETGQIVSCGGSATGSLVGGVIGYHIQKSNDAQCEADFAANGFERIQPAAGEEPVETQKAPETPKTTQNFNN